MALSHERPAIIDYGVDAHAKGKAAVIARLQSRVVAGRISLGGEMVRTVCATLDSGAATRVGVEIWGVPEWGEYERGWFETRRSFSRRPGLPVSQREAAWLAINPGEEDGVRLLSQVVEWQDGAPSEAVTIPRLVAHRRNGLAVPTEISGLAEQPLAARPQLVRGIHEVVLGVACANDYTPQPINY